MSVTEFWLKRASELAAMDYREDIHGLIFEASLQPTYIKLWVLLWLSCLKQEGQTEEEGALQQTCLLLLVNMSTASKSSNEAQQHIPTCCLQLLGPGAVVDPFRG